MFSAIWEAVSKPNSFFASLPENDALVNRALWLVLIVAALGGVAIYSSSLPLVQALPEGSVLRLIAPAGSALAAAATTLATWLVKGLLVRVGAGLSVKPWAVAAYSFTPYLLIYILFLLTTALPVNLPPITADFATEAELVQEQFDQRALVYAASAPGRITQILGYIGDIWSVLLIFIGVRAISGLRKAAVAGGLVGALVFITDLALLLARPL